MRIPPIVVVACLIVGASRPAVAQEEECRFGEGWLLVTAQMSWTSDIRGDEIRSSYNEERKGPILITLCEINQIWTPAHETGGTALDLRAPQGVSYRLFVEESLKDICGALPNCRDATRRRGTDR